MRAVPTQAAIRDMALAVADIGDESPRAARGFMAAMQDAAINLGRHPQMGSERPELADPPVRFWPVPRYRYVVVYNSAGIPPRILRVLHGSRDLPTLLSNLRSG